MEEDIYDIMDKAFHILRKKNQLILVYDHCYEELLDIKFCIDSMNKDLSHFYNKARENDANLYFDKAENCQQTDLSRKFSSLKNQIHTKSKYSVELMIAVSTLMIIVILYKFQY